MKKVFGIMLMGFALVAMGVVDAPPSVIVESVKFRQRYPWNGLVDIDAKISCSDANTNLAVYVAAWDNVKDRALTVKTIWVDGDATENPDLVTKSGTTRLVWDARADNPNEISQNVSVSVQAYIRDRRYLVIDLSNGPDATEYPYYYRADPPEGGWTYADKTTNLVLRLIPAGTFMMGSPEDELGHSDGWYAEEIRHKVTLTKPFYIGVFEVTQKQHELVRGDNPSQYKGDARPVEMCIYNGLRGGINGTHWPEDNLVDADTFFGRIRKRTGLTFDFPTEAQWEYACRAETATAFNSNEKITAYWKCDNLAEVGRYSANRNDGRGGYSQHTTVGSYLPNQWGLYDMHGNVSEWCLDWVLQNLGTESAIDPVGPKESNATWTKGQNSGYCRVIRGGNWYVDANCCRSAYRTCATYGGHDAYPDGRNGRYNDWGFRVVVQPDSE